MTTNGEGDVRTRGGMKKLLAVSATALIAGAALAVPALALPGPAGINGAGKNISVFHNIDFVAAIGYQPGTEMTVEVFKKDGTTLKGTATGTAVDAEGEGAGLEVNHGPEGAPVPGDCWEGTVPNVVPGDLIRVTGTNPNGTEVTDEVLVDNIRINRAPADNTATVKNKTDVIVRGVASYANGTPIPIAKLNSGEVRQPKPRFRANPNRIIRTPGTTNGWTAIYRAPYKIFQMPDPLTLAQQKRAVLNGTHAMGYGHVAPLPPETQLVEGVGTANGPAAGCPGGPAGG